MENVKSGAYGVWQARGKQKIHKNFVRETWKKVITLKILAQMKDNIKMDIKKFCQRNLKECYYFKDLGSNIR